MPPNKCGGLLLEGRVTYLAPAIAPQTPTEQIEQPQALGKAVAYQVPECTHVSAQQTCPSITSLCSLSRLPHNPQGASKLPGIRTTQSRAVSFSQGRVATGKKRTPSLLPSLPPPPIGIKSRCPSPVCLLAGRRGVSITILPAPAWLVARLSAEAGLSEYGTHTRYTWFVACIYYA
jgi:hypothetical protein